MVFTQELAGRGEVGLVKWAEGGLGWRQGFVGDAGFEDAGDEKVEWRFLFQ